MNSSVPKPLRTKHDAAIRLSVSKRTVDRYIAAGLLRAIRISPRVVRLHEEDIEKLVK